MSTHLSTAPHQSRKKRELTRAVELLKIKYGGERVRLTKIFWHIIISINNSLYSTLSLLFRDYSFLAYCHDC